MDRNNLCDSEEARRRRQTELLVKFQKDATVGIEHIFSVFLSVFIEPCPKFGAADTPLLLLLHQNRYDRNGPLAGLYVYFLRQHWMLRQTPPGGGCWFMSTGVSINKPTPLSTNLTLRPQ